MFRFSNVTFVMYKLKVRITWNQIGKNGNRFVFHVYKNIITTLIVPINNKINR